MNIISTVYKGLAEVIEGLAAYWSYKINVKGIDIIDRVKLLCSNKVEEGRNLGEKGCKENDKVLVILANNVVLLKETDDVEVEGGAHAKGSQKEVVEKEKV